MYHSIKFAISGKNFSDSYDILMSGGSVLSIPQFPIEPFNSEEFAIKTHYLQEPLYGYRLEETRNQRFL